MGVDVGIVCALKLEARSLQTACKLKPERSQPERSQPERLPPWPFFRGDYRALGLGLIVSGIGKVSAAAATQYLIDHTKPEFVINWGCAGGTRPDGINAPQAQLGEVVAAKWAVEYDYQSRSPRRIAADSKLFELACSIDGIKPGILASADQNVDSLEKRQRLWREHRASACDWESAAVLRVAAVNSIPAITLRVISDMSDCKPGPEFNARADALMAKATPILLKYMSDLSRSIT